MAKRKKPHASRRKDARRPIASRASLAELRSELDAIDREILAAINRRAEVAKQIGELKQAGNADASSIRSAKRRSFEQAVANNAGRSATTPCGPCSANW